MKKLCL
jgi:hypothetical protein